jgi:hypothetical protein
MFGKFECPADIQIDEKYSRCLESGGLKNCSEKIQLRDAGKLFGKDSNVRKVFKMFEKKWNMVEKQSKKFGKYSRSFRKVIDGCSKCIL